ncbi:MAG: hypothetical protein JXN59_08590 [Anaerolineae bacterium]|nr:hypothetical protein [Anaerolineae bacterium]
MQSPPSNPDYHFLIFAPGLESWLFRAGERYWDTYRPIVYSMAAPDDFALVRIATGGRRRVAVTLAMRRDTAPAVQAALGDLEEQVYLDPLVYDSPTDLYLTLNARVERDQRFGVPAVPDSPEATRTPGPVVGG